MGTQTLLVLLESLVVGRLCLSMLPPGWPGDHDRRELGATLCASWLLGGAALAALPWLWIWAAILVLRLALLPGGLRPRHEHDRSARPLWLVLFAACATAQWFGDPWHWNAGFLCGTAFLLTGWSTWKRRADRRARIMAGLGLVAATLLFWLG